MKKSIIIVEDEADIRELLCYNLERDGYDIQAMGNGEKALEVIQKKLPDLILLDLMLPGINGLDICRTLKKSTDTEQIPIIMVTAKGEESDIVAGLELGADDYITKPFSIKILLARIRTVLRRAEKPLPDEQTPIHSGPLSIIPDRHQVLLKNKPVELTASEFRILYFLASHPGWVRTREQIIDAVRGVDYAVTERSIDVQIVGLRRKLGRYANMLETVRGIGYRFQEV